MLDLSIRDMTVRTAAGRRLIAVPALDVRAGATLAIRGPSGAGKSTLLAAMAGLIAISSGRLSWGGTELSSLSDAARTAFRGASFGIVFQDPLLFEELSPAQNAGLAALYAPRARRAGIVAAAAERLAQLGLPAGAARDVTSFSGGERQRIAVARALAADPKVILADEPTASLDRPMADALITDLFATARDGGRSLIVVSHDPNLLAAADRVLTIEDGQVTGDA